LNKGPAFSTEFIFNNFVESFGVDGAMGFDYSTIRKYFKLIFENVKREALIPEGKEGKCYYFLEPGTDTMGHVLKAIDLLPEEDSLALLGRNKNHRLEENKGKRGLFIENWNAI